MSLLTLPDFYYRRFGAGPEDSGIIMMISFIVLVAGNLALADLSLSLSCTLISSGQC